MYFSSVHNYNPNIYFLFVTMTTLISTCCIWNTLKCVDVLLPVIVVIHLPMFAVPTKIKLMSLTSSHGKMYSVKPFVMKFVSDYETVVLSRDFCFNVQLI